MEKITTLDLRFSNETFYNHSLFPGYLFCSKGVFNKEGRLVGILELTKETRYKIKASDGIYKSVKLHRILYECYHNVLLKPTETILFSDKDHSNLSYDNLSIGKSVKVYQSVLTPEIKKTIQKLHQAGLTIKQMARRVKVSHTTVYNYVRRL